MVSTPWSGPAQDPTFEDSHGAIRRLLIILVLTIAVFLTAPPARGSEENTTAWSRMPLGAAEFGAFSPNGRWSVTTEAGKVVKVCSVQRANDNRRLENPTDHYLHYARVSADGSLAVGVAKGAAIVWDVETGRVLRIVDAAASELDGFRIAASPDATRIALLRAGGVTEIQVASTGEKLAERSGRTGSLSFTEDGKHVVSWSAAESDSETPAVEIWDSQTGKTTARFALDFDGADGCSASWSISADGARLAVADSEEGRLYLYDEKRGSAPVVVGAESAQSTALAFSPDGKVLVTAGDVAIELREAATGKILRRIATSGGEVLDVSFSADGARFATAGTDHVIRVWDIGACKLVGTHATGSQGGFRTVGLSADGSAIMAIGEEDQSFLWRSQPVRRVVARAR